MLLTLRGESEPSRALSRAASLIKLLLPRVWRLTGFVGQGSEVETDLCVILSVSLKQTGTEILAHTLLRPRDVKGGDVGSWTPTAPAQRC